MLKSCKYCGRIHDSRVDCGQKPKPRPREKEQTEITKLRTCRRFDKVRKRVNERDRHLCRLCLLEKRLTTKKLETHHIDPLCEAPERAYDESNLITLCTHHHKAADAGKIERNKLFLLAKSPVSLG